MLPEAPVPRPPLSPRATLGLKLGGVVFWALAIGIVLAVARARLNRPSGQDLNRLAWEASFRERGLPLPASGPRDGYWGRRMPKPVPDPDVGWREAEVHLPGVVETDGQGIQWSGSEAKDACRIAIVGASVAWGAYASSIQTTYFARLSERIGAEVGPVRVAVIAGGAWDSENELMAVRTRALPLRPDLIVLVDGMNDLTDSAARRRRRLGWPEVPPARRVARCLENQAAIRDLAARQGVTTVFVLQPVLLQKKHKSALEQRILELTLDKALTEDFLENAVVELRRGLEAVCGSQGAHCIDASGVFDQESATTFTDMWHFADPGHALLADALGPKLAPIVAGLPCRRTAPDRGLASQAAPR